MLFSKKQLFVLSAIFGIEVVALISCGSTPAGVSSPARSDVEIQVQLVNALGKTAGRLKTEFDSLVVEVDGPDIEPMRFASAIDPAQLFFIDTLPQIPTGPDRQIRITTINRNGDVIHADSSGLRTIRVDPNVITIVQVVLVPVRGSIYLQIGGVPTAVDSICAVFTADDGRQWNVSVPRSPKVYASIDGIPHNTHGTLVVAGVTAIGDTLYRAEAVVKVNALATNGVQLSFQTTPGGVALSGSVQLPGAMVVSGSMGTMPVAKEERGDLLITEIMYAANDSEYIEVYNPGNDAAVFDSVYLDIDGTRRLFTSVTIAARSYFVFGRKQLPWVDANHSVSSALDLSSNGNWISLLSKDGSVIDQVVFTGGSNDLEWPRISGKRSICLADNSYSSDGNNFGRNWITASTVIEGAAGQMGTPHAP